MQVKVTEGSHLVIEGKEYKPGDKLALEGTQLKVQLDAGIVEKVVKKGKK